MADDYGNPVPFSVEDVSRGIRKLCISKQCGGLSASCENSQPRDQACEVVDFYDAPDNSTTGGGCLAYRVRTELDSIGDRISNPVGQTGTPGFGEPRRRGSGNLFGKPGEKKGKGSDKLILPPHLQKKPDLMVKRHISRGRNINEDSPIPDDGDDNE